MSRVFERSLLGSHIDSSNVWEQPLSDVYGTSYASCYEEDELHRRFFPRGISIAKKRLESELNDAKREAEIANQKANAALQVVGQLIQIVNRLESKGRIQTSEYKSRFEAVFGPLVPEDDGEPIKMEYLPPELLEMMASSNE